MSKIATNKTKIKQKIESLERQSQVIRGEIEDELELTKKRVIDFGKIALGISGGLIFSAIVLKGLTGSGSKNNISYDKHRSKRVYQRFIGQLFDELSGQAVEFLLKAAKDKLSSYKENNENAKDDDSESAG